MPGRRERSQAAEDRLDNIRQDHHDGVPSNAASRAASPHPSNPSQQPSTDPDQRAFDASGGKAFITDTEMQCLKSALPKPLYKEVKDDMFMRGRTHRHLPYGNGRSAVIGHKSFFVYDAFETLHDEVAVHQTVPAQVRRVMNYAKRVIIMDRSAEGGRSTIIFAAGVPSLESTKKDGKPLPPVPTDGRVIMMKINPDISDGVTYKALPIEVSMTEQRNRIYGAKAWCDDVQQRTGTPLCARTDFQNGFSKATIAIKDSKRQQYKNTLWMPEAYTTTSASFDRQLVIDFSFDAEHETVFKTMLALQNKFNAFTNVISFRGRIAFDSADKITPENMDYIQGQPGVKFVNRLRTSLPNPQSREANGNEQEPANLNYAKEHESSATNKSLIVLPIGGPLPQQWAAKVASTKLSTGAKKQKKEAVAIGKLTAWNSKYALIEASSVAMANAVHATATDEIRIIKFSWFIEHHNKLEKDRQESIERQDEEENGDEEEEEDEEVSSSSSETSDEDDV